MFVASEISYCRFPVALLLLLLVEPASVLYAEAEDLIAVGAGRDLLLWVPLSGPDVLPMPMHLLLRLHLFFWAWSCSQRAPVVVCWEARDRQSCSHDMRTARAYVRTSQEWNTVRHIYNTYHVTCPLQWFWSVYVVR